VARREQFPGHVAAIVGGQTFVLDVRVARMGRSYRRLQIAVGAPLSRLPFVRERNDVRLHVSLRRQHVVVLVPVVRAAQALRDTTTKMFRTTPVLPSPSPFARTFGFPSNSGPT